MKVALSVPGKFHTFDLARELQTRGMLAGVLSAYPGFKLRHEGVPRSLLQTFPWLLTPYMVAPLRNRVPLAQRRAWEHLIATSFDAWTARRLPACDVYVGLSGASLQAGRVQRERGGRYVCDRGSAHIRTQDRLLREEHRTWGIPFTGIDPRTIEREEAEYAQADGITVPSGFAARSFLEQGVPAHKLRVLPYGVDLTRFQPDGEADPSRFRVLFVGALSLQKGIPYLLQAFARLRHPRKQLVLAGMVAPALIDRWRGQGLWPDDCEVLGHVPQAQLKRVMSRCHVLALPSVQDGFGMVMAQAMACACPVIASEHTGARELFTDGEEGLVVPARDANALAEGLQRLADDPALRAAMAQRARARVKALDGWSAYGDRAVHIFRELASA